MILDKFKLDGKVAVVTGAGRGLGQGAALGFAEAGADLALVDILSTDETAAQVRALGRRVSQVHANLMDRASIQPVVDRVVGELGGIDILLNNAAMMRRAASTDETAAQVRALGRRVSQVHANLMDRASIQPVVDRGVGELGGIDILLNNA